MLGSRVGSDSDLLARTSPSLPVSPSGLSQTWHHRETLHLALGHRTVIGSVPSEPYRRHWVLAGKSFAPSRVMKELPTTNKLPSSTTSTHAGCFLPTNRQHYDASTRYSYAVITTSSTSNTDGSTYLYLYEYSVRSKYLRTRVGARAPTPESLTRRRALRRME